MGNYGFGSSQVDHFMVFYSHVGNALSRPLYNGEATLLSTAATYGILWWRSFRRSAWTSELFCERSKVKRARVSYISLSAYTCSLSSCILFCFSILGDECVK